MLDIGARQGKQGSRHHRQWIIRYRTKGTHVWCRDAGTLTIGGKVNGDMKRRTEIGAGRSRTGIVRCGCNTDEIRQGRVQLRTRGNIIMVVVVLR